MSGMPNAGVDRPDRGDGPPPIEFACESCGARARAAASLIGRTVKCRHCKHVFVVPAPGESFATEYEMNGPPDEPAAAEPSSTFRSAYRDPLDVPAGDRPRRKKTRPKPPSRFAVLWRPIDVMLGEYNPRAAMRVIGIIGGVGGAVAASSLAIPPLWAIGGWVPLVLGFLMVAVGFFVGAFAAATEDLLYGFAYLVFPIYTGYYLVKNWDELWPWFACSTIGFVLFTAGAFMLRAGGSA